MTIQPGTKLGPYEVLGPLGAGGMGVVWRARDTRLDRVVAIKALPDAFAGDPERLARFEREARLLASLSHPNIGAIYGLEESGGHRHLVLEYIEGETLADRLRRGPMPIAGALDACRQIAAALEAAHESGIIHRDLKPGNVKLTPQGEIKVLDFGLAKGAAGDPGAGLLTQSPTVTLGMTGAGIILGTAAYMSPEQARGKPLDRRTDIWSFGCVLYECLTGRLAFEGETVSDMIARILERDPDWSALPANTPPGLRELARRCLEKDARQRLRDIGDARIELDRLRAASASGAIPTTAAPGGTPARRGSPVALVGALLAGVLLGGVAWSLLGPGPRDGADRTTPTHLALALPADPKIEFFHPSRTGFVAAGRPAHAPGAARPAERLYYRALDGFEWREIAGTEDVRRFEISADGRWLVVLVPLEPGGETERLARIPVDGSAPPVTIATWDSKWHLFALLESGDILLVDEPGERMGILPAHGGAPQEKRIDRGSVSGSMRDVADVLPRDRAVLFDSNIYLEKGWGVQTLALDPKTATLHTVVDVGGGARYRDGHLLFARGEVLLGAPFDPGRLAMTSAPVALERGLRCAYRHLPGDFDIGPTGDLYLVPGGELASTRRLGIVGPDGRVTPLGARMASFGQWPSASASGREFVAISTNAEGIDEIWYGTVDRPGLRRVVAWPDADAVAALLSPDGRTVAYGRFGRDDLDGVYLADVRSTDGGRRILRPESTAVRYRPDGWSPDGRRLLLSRLVRGGTSDLWLAELDTARDTLVGIRRLMNAHVDFAYDISPDGRWLAWDSNASGRYEVYAAEVSSDGTLGDPIPITDDGGTVPEWTSDGRRLVVRDESRLRVRIVEVGMPPGPGPHRSRPWFDGAENGVRDFSVLPGDRAIALLRGENERDQIETAHVIVGWTRTLRKRLAAGP